MGKTSRHMVGNTTADVTVDGTRVPMRPPQHAGEACGMPHRRRAAYIDEHMNERSDWCTHADLARVLGALRASSAGRHIMCFASRQALRVISSRTPPAANQTSPICDIQRASQLSGPQASSPSPCSPSYLAGSDDSWRATPALASTTRYRRRPLTAGATPPR